MTNTFGRRSADERGEWRRERAGGERESWANWNGGERRARGGEGMRAERNEDVEDYLVASV